MYATRRSWLMITVQPHFCGGNFIFYIQAQQAQKEAQMKQEQAMKQDHFDSSDATAKSKVSRFL